MGDALSPAGLIGFHEDCARDLTKRALQTKDDYRRSVAAFKADYHRRAASLIASQEREIERLKGVAAQEQGALESYIADYVMSTEGADYVPTDWERELIEDALCGWESERSLLQPVPPEGIECYCGGYRGDHRPGCPEIEAEREAASVPPEGEGVWRGIESAPKDGRAILVFGGGADHVTEASYNETIGCWDTASYTLDDRDDEAEGYSRPTHWMPLPAAPVSAPEVMKP